MARLLHRSHLLCLLSRGLLYDQAASDPLLQVGYLVLDFASTTCAATWLHQVWSSFLPVSAGHV